MAEPTKQSWSDDVLYIDYMDHVLVLADNHKVIGGPPLLLRLKSARPNDDQMVLTAGDVLQIKNLCERILARLAAEALAGSDAPSLQTETHGNG